MNTRKLILVIAAIVGGGAAAAQSAEMHVGDTAGLRDALSATSQRSRAEVHAEAVAANALRARVAAYGDSALLDRMVATPSTLARAQVRAEAIEAQRLGLLTSGEAEARRATPAEIESVRQAGLRAIGLENVARR